MSDARRWSVRAGTWMAVLALVASVGCSRDGLGPAVRLDEPEGTAASFSWPYYTDIVASGDRVAAAYMTLNGKQDRHVVVRQSDDGGKTWSAQSLLDVPEYGDTISVAPRLAVAPGDALLAVWQARRNRAGQKFILARRSTDFGRSWGPTARLNAAAQSFPVALASRPDGRMLVAYSDERNIARDIFAYRSTDGGATWLDKDVIVDPAPDSESLGLGAALGQGDDAYVIWEERAKGASPKLLLARSADAGASWGPARRVDPADGPASPLWPAVVASAGRLTAVWTAGLIGTSTKSWLWVASSTDGGETWSKPQLFYEGPSQAIFHLLAKGPHVYLAWNAGGSDGSVGIYFNASDDGGATWRQPLDAPLRIDDGGGAKRSAARPRMALAGESTVAVVWQESERRIALAVSSDDGRSWPQASTTIATVDHGKLRFPQVAASEAAAYVIWEQWADMEGQRKTLADVQKLTPLDVWVRRVALR